MRHYWVEAPAVLDSALSYFASEGYDVFGATTYSGRDHWTTKYGDAAPLETQPLLLRSPPSTPFPSLKGGAGGDAAATPGRGVSGRGESGPPRRGRAASASTGNE